MVMLMKSASRGPSEANAQESKLVELEQLLVPTDMSDRDAEWARARAARSAAADALKAAQASVAVAWQTYGVLNGFSEHRILKNERKILAAAEQVGQAVVAAYASE